ncbi:ATP-binding protein [Marinobacter lutaoensis]|uniref:ATP-binding protein n=1 Tax=Marinobacter lutaoensis TaxID=135739 RepID=UPI0034A0B10B
MLRTFSLGTRLALITIAGTLTTVASVLLIAYSALVEDFESILTHQQRYETQRIARTVDEKLNLRVDLLSEFAKNLSDGGSLRDRTEMEQLLARQQMLQQLFPDGLVVFDENATALLETLHVPGRIGTNYADREHFQRLMRTRQPVISRPMIGRATGVPLVTFSAPIESDDGALLGIVSGVLRLGDASLLPPEELHAMQKDGALFRVVDSNNFLFIEGREGLGKAIQSLPPPGADPLIDAALSGITFGQLTTADGRRMVYATSYLEPLGWLFIRAVPMSWATAPAQASFLKFFSISIGIALAIALFSLIATRSATRRLEAMTQRIDRMVRSPEGVRLEESGPPEVRDLARAFNRLMDERDSMATLKENFVSNVSHELRTPLTSMNGALRLVHSGATGPLPPRAGDMVRLALRNGERLQGLISDLLDFSKLTSGRMSVRMLDVPVAEVIRDTIDGNQALAREYQVTLTGHGDSNLAAQADPHRLRQVLDNLVSNAIKFSPAGGTVTLSARPGNHGTVRLIVSDQGKGVPAAFEQQLFERFAQAETGTNRSVSGTGLGLAICKELAELMEGRIGYYFEAGAHFWLELAAARPARSAALRYPEGKTESHR